MIVIVIVIAIAIAIAIMWTGFKMMFQHTKWSEVAQIFFGGILVGGAATIEPQLFVGGTGTGINPGVSLYPRAPSIN